MTQNPLLIVEIAHIICDYIDYEDLPHLALTCRVLYYASCAKIWKSLQPKTQSTLRKIKNTLDSNRTGYNKLVYIFKWSAREEAHTLEGPFFNSFLFPNLRELEFSNADAQDHIVHSFLTTSPKLRSINLSRCYCLSTKAIRPLFDFSPDRLERLNLYGCSRIDPLIIATIILRHSNSLKSVRLTDITDVILNAIQRSTCLNDLGLEHCSRLSTTSLNRLFCSLSQLTHIRLRDIPDMTSDHLTSLVNVCFTALVHCELIECNQIQNEALTYMASKCVSIKTLLVPYHPNITNETVQLFIINCHSLTHVDISGCRLLTDHAFFPNIDNQDHQMNYAPSVQILHISNLDILPSQTIHRLLSQFHQLRTMHLGSSYSPKVIDQILNVINSGSSQFYWDNKCATIRRAYIFQSK
ncbi:hypothetical protein BDB01DRAFT_771030 [Pilobolus umbonatus]|nr:hypothetical protein BDB01DRAFT_771030 [Pilobolus umbonatus]